MWMSRPRFIYMTQSKHHTTTTIASNLPVPAWLKQLSEVLSKLEPAYAWNIFQGLQDATRNAGRPSFEKVEVVYCEHPRIMVTVKDGVWSLECSFKPKKSKPVTQREQQEPAKRDRDDR